MPRRETILRVFVASPSDLAEERETLESVIRELNNTWSKTLEIRLELVGWETHTYPAFGDDAQSVINDQIAGDYDIFIGIMWTRFGTPTGRAGSGTAEEFYRAYKRHQENPHQVRIMFYFKDAPISPSDLEPEQLASIRNFQKELGEKGGYYWTFTNGDEFAQLARMHLGRQAQEWGKSWGLEMIGGEAAVQTEEASPLLVAKVELEREDDIEYDDEGYLDLLEAGQESFESMNEAMARMTTALQELGAKVGTGADELNKAKSPTGNIDIKQAKRISNRVAEALSTFAALMEVDVPVFAGSYSSGMEAFSRAFSLAEDFGPQDKEDLKKAYESIQQLYSTITEVKGQMLSFRDTIANTPRATTMYNRARKRALSILDKLDEEFAAALNLASEMEKTLSLLLAE
jgi:hypothetical protein